MLRRPGETWATWQSMCWAFHAVCVVGISCADPQHWGCCFTDCGYQGATEGTSHGHRFKRGSILLGPLRRSCRQIQQGLNLRSWSVPHGDAGMGLGERWPCGWSSPDTRFCSHQKAG